MKKRLSKRDKELNELVDEIVELISNSKKLKDMLKTIKESEMIQKKNSSEIAFLKSKIRDIENMLKKLISNFRIDIIEVERMITEKYEDINKRNELEMEKLQFEIQQIKNTIYRKKD